MSRPTLPRRATLKDVAARAEVSLSTASLVFSGKGPVSVELATRVRSAAEALDYSGPDPVASSLRHGRTGIVAVAVEAPLTVALRDPFALQVLDGLAEELSGDGHGLLLLAQDPDDPHDLARRVGTMAMDALVFPLCGPGTNPLVAVLAARGLPIVAAGSPEGPGVIQLRTDEAGAQALAVAHLHELGHTRLGHVTLPLGARGATAPAPPDQVLTSDQTDARERALGFLAAAGADSPVVQAAASDVAEGEAAARLLLGLPAGERPTGIVAQSDVLAAGVIRAAESMGLSVPDDLSVTGYDGIRLPWLDHTLTTIVQPGVEKGRELGSLVRAALAGERPSDRTYDVSLRRGTTTAPRSPSP